MVVADFIAGLLVGTLLGLALAPVLRTWMAWKIFEQARRAAEVDHSSDRNPVEP